MRASAFYLLAVVIAAQSAIAAPKTRAPAALAGYEAVPLTRGPQNHLIMAGSISGRPASLLIDTGADLSFIRADRAQEFGVRSRGEYTFRRDKPFQLGSLDGISAGGVRFGATKVALFDPAQLRGTVPGKGSADGVIGLDLLELHKAVINCRTMQIFFQTDRSRRLDLAGTTRALGFVQIPLEKSRRGGLTVPCLLRGRPARMTVDTGAFITGFDDDAMRALGLTGQPSALTTRGFSGEVRPMQLTKIEDFKIGGLQLAPDTFAIMDLYGKKKTLRTFTGLGRIEYYAARSPAERILGAVGNDLLYHRHAIIDLDRMALYLK